MKDSLKLDLYLGLMLIYALSEAILGSGYIVTFSRWPLFFISLYYYLKVMMGVKKEPFFISALGLLYMMFFIYGVIVIFEGKEFHVWRTDNRTMRSFSYLLQITDSLLPIFVFYYFSKIKVLTANYVQNRMPMFLLVVGICYYVNLQNNILEKGTDEVTNNSGYLVLSIFPMLLFLKARSWKQYLFVGICLVLIFLSMKRGAILISLLCFAVYFYYLLGNSKNTVPVIAILLIMVVSIYIGYEHLMSSNDYFQERVNKTLDGNSNGRDVIFFFFYNYFLHRTTQEEFLIGKGANATLEIFGQYAHNDWLEIMINQGLFGLVVYLIYWWSFLLLCKKKHIVPQIKTALIILFVIYFMKTIFSMSYRDYTVYSTMTLGYCVAMSYARVHDRYN